MIRKYKLKKKINISKFLTLVKALPNESSNTFYWNGVGKQYFVNDYPVILPYQEEVLKAIPDCLYKTDLSIQILTVEGTIDSHTDGVSKRCMLIPIRCSSNTILWEEERETILEVNKLYTFNDYNRHGLLTQHDKSKTVFIGIS
jgi:hypothetical protein